MKEDLPPHLLLQHVLVEYDELPSLYSCHNFGNEKNLVPIPMHEVLSKTHGHKNFYCFQFLLLVPQTLYLHIRMNNTFFSQNGRDGHKTLFHNVSKSFQFF